MNVTFSVPAYPQFRPGLAGVDYAKHEVYMRRFESYACASLKCQVEAALAVAEKMSVGDLRTFLELETKRMREVADGLVETAAGVVERATVGVDASVSQVSTVVASGVQSAIEKVFVVEGVDEIEVEVSEKTLANRAKRHARAQKKRLRREGVPEWRRGAPVVTAHCGAFSGCSEEVQRELRETRAKMLIEKNKTEVVKMEHERRRTAARLQSRLVEQEVEIKRLKDSAEQDRLVKAQVSKWPAGYAETLLSVGIETLAEVDLPSSEGSVSPSSSISVAELKRKNDAIIAMTARIAELELREKAAGVRAEPVADNKSEWVPRDNVEEAFAEVRFSEKPVESCMAGSGLDGYSRWD